MKMFYLWISGVGRPRTAYETKSKRKKKKQGIFEAECAIGVVFEAAHSKIGRFSKKKRNKTVRCERKNRKRMVADFDLPPRRCIYLFMQITLKHFNRFEE